MNIQTLNEYDELDNTIKNASNPVVVDIWMNDCPPCNMLAPKLKAVAQDYKGQVSVFKINVDNDSPVFNEFDVETIPTLLFFKDGKEISRLEGVVHSKELDQHFKQALEK